VLLAPANAIVQFSADEHLMFLTSHDIVKLTGYSRPSAQIRWLRRNGWRFTVNALSEPVVAIAESNRKLVSGFTITTQQPDIGALNGQTA
jgi:Domain of unknown function (DUF4224)